MKSHLIYSNNWHYNFLLYYYTSLYILYTVDWVIWYGKHYICRSSGHREMSFIWSYVSVSPTFTPFSSSFGLYQVLSDKSGSFVAKCSTVFMSQSLTTLWEHLEGRATADNYFQIKGLFQQCNLKTLVLWKNIDYSSIFWKMSLFSFIHESYLKDYVKPSS